MLVNYFIGLRYSEMPCSECLQRAELLEDPVYAIGELELFALLRQNLPVVLVEFEILIGLFYFCHFVLVMFCLKAQLVLRFSFWIVSTGSYFTFCLFRLHQVDHLFPSFDWIHNLDCFGSGSIQFPRFLRWFYFAYIFPISIWFWTPSAQNQLDLLADLPESHLLANPHWFMAYLGTFHLARPKSRSWRYPQSHPEVFAQLTFSKILVAPQPGLHRHFCSENDESAYFAPLLHFFVELSLYQSWESWSKIVDFDWACSIQLV